MTRKSESRLASMRSQGGPVRLGAVASNDDTAPKWNQYLLTGRMFRSDFPDGIDISRSDMETMVSNWRSAGGNELPVDYHHYGSSSDVMHPDFKVASGWIQDLRITDLPDGRSALEGLTAWTDKARERITANELKYVSATFATNAMNPKTGDAQGPTLYGAGLLNDPFLTELPRVAASNSPTHTAPTKAAQAEGNTMDKKLICAAFGLSEDADDSMIAAAVNSGAEAVKKLAAAEATALSAKAEVLTFSSHADSLTTEKTTLTEQVTKLSAEVTKLTGEKFDASVVALTDKLMKAGKLVAANSASVAEYAKAMGVEKAEKFFGAQPVVVKLGEVGHGNGGGEPVEMSRKEAKEKFAALVDVERAKGVKVELATRTVSKAHPEIAKAAR